MPDLSIAEALKNYPLAVELKDRSFTLRPMDANDGPQLLTFASELPQHDILFMRRDITRQSGIDQWLRDISTGHIHSVLAEDEQGVVGYSTIHLNDLEWSAHVAEMRVTTGDRARGVGLGRLLTREGFNIAMALGVEKIVARMTTDQTGARALFHELGFQNEALLKDHVKDRHGARHDLLLMACEVQTFLQTRDAYGIVN
jgi:L-amino acid N-acyltransferase YncA